MPGAAEAASFTFGSPLLATPNVSPGCETEPGFPDSSGNFPAVASGVPDCTWRQGGVPFAPASDTRYSTVPADGRIIQAEVRSGPTPAPLRFVILEQIETVCCYFVTETVPVPLAPNAVTTVPLNLPVQRNAIGGAQVYDIVAVSAASGTGSLPLSSNGHNNASQETEPGNPIAGFWYPRMGSLPGDGTPGGGRRESGFPGVELLVRWTFCPAGETCGATGGNPGTGNQAGIGPALFNKTLRLKNNRALIRLLCNGSATCAGELDLVNLGAVPAVAKKKVVIYGKAMFSLPAGGKATIRVKLNSKGKRLVKNRKSVKLGLKITPKSGSVVTSHVTLKH